MHMKTAASNQMVESKLASERKKWDAKAKAQMQANGIMIDDQYNEQGRDTMLNSPAPSKQKKRVSIAN